MYGRHEISLRKRTALPKYDIARSIAGRSLACRMQGLEKRNKGCGFRWTQVFSVGGHVSASLNHLADKLVLRKPHRNAVERRPPLSAEFTERMAIAALLGLEDESPLPLKCGGVVQKLFWHRIAAPSVHVWAPRRIASEMGECSQDYGDQQNRQDSDWPPAPTLFPFSR